MNQDEFSRRNPFSDQYFLEELEFYGRPSAFQDCDGMTLKYVVPHGRLDDFLNVNFRINDKEVPLLSAKYGVWMSLTWMEVQSAHVAIAAAHGNAATLGLGLGYFVLRSLPFVDHLDVYEKNQELVDWFKEEFKDRIGNKVTFIIGDARENLIDKEYDFVYSDIYDSILPDEVIKDVDTFTAENEISEFRVWGQELAVLEILKSGDDVTMLENTHKDLALIIKWNEHNDLRRRSIDIEFSEKLLESLELAHL